MKISIALLLFSFLYLGVTAQNSWQFNDSQKKIYSITSVDNQSLTSEFQFAELITSEFTTPDEVFISLESPGFGKTYKAGEPDLPIYYQLIAVPNHVNLSLDGMNFNEKEISLYDSKNNRFVKPAIASVSKSQDPDKIKYRKGKNYSQSGFVETPVVELIEVGIMRNLKVYQLVYHPLIYNAASNTLKVRHQAKVSLSWEGSISNVQNWNFTQFDFFQTSSVKTENNQETYVIVSPTKYKETLQSFVNWKKQQGFYVLEAYIGESISSSDKNVIKTYLAGLYNNPATGVAAPSYILLVGDVADIPAWNGETDSHVTDLYYAEYTGDFLPEVLYGRFSAANTTQLTNIISKTLYVEKGSGNQRAYQNEHLLVSGVDGSYASTWGNGALNYFMDYYSNAEHGINAHHYLYGSGSPVVSNSPQAHQAMINDFNTGMGVAYYTAHCGVDGWADPSFSISDISGLSNANEYPLMIGNCCQSYSYNSTSFGEEIVRAANKGAVVYIGASNYSYWDEDYYWGIGYRTNIVAHPTYDATKLGSWDAWFHTHAEPVEKHAYTAGEMLYVGNMAVQASTSDLKGYYWEIYGIMGDPSLVPAKYQTEVVTATYNEILVVGQSAMDVSAPEGSTVTIMENNQVLSVGKTDATEKVTLSFSSLTNIGEKQVVLTVLNPDFAPFIDSLRVIAPNGPFLVVSEILITDSLGNQNNAADYGETMNVYLQIKNFGNEEAQQIKLSVHSNTEWISNPDENQNIELENISANGMLNLESPIQLDLKNNIPDQTTLGFTGTLTFNETYSVSFDFDFNVNAPSIAETDWAIDQQGVGNQNGIIEVNEEVTLTVFFSNLGHSQVSNTTITFTSTDENKLTVITQSGLLGGFDPSQLKSMDVIVKGGESFFNGDQVSLNYQIQTGNNSQYTFKGSVPVTLGEEPEYLMSDGTHEIVTGNFYDSGGPDGKYSNNENYTMTFTPHNEGEGLQIDFETFDVESTTNGSCWDKLYVYNGATTDAPLIGSYCSVNYVNSIQSHNESGALTFKFTSDNNTTKNGWKAYLSSAPRHSINFFVTNGVDPVSEADITLSVYSQQTTHEGYALFSHVLVTDELSYSISKEGYFTQTGSLSEIISDTTLTILLEKLPEICFTVSENTTALEGALIIFNNQEMTTDENGKAIFAAVEPGTKTFRASKEGYVDTTGTIVVGMVDACYSIQLHLVLTYVAKFIVSDEFGFVSDALVTINTNESVTDVNGEISFAGLYEGTHAFMVKKSGYLDYSGTISISDSNIVSYVTLSHVTYGVTFVVTSLGEGVSNAGITVLNNELTTDINGTATMYGIIPARAIPFTVAKEGYNSHEGTFDIIDSEVSVEVELSMVGISKTSGAGFNVYPNPLNGNKILRISSAETITQLKVFNYSGTLLIHQLEPNKEILVDFAKFAKGIYILQAQVGEQLFIEKVIVE